MVWVGGEVNFLFVEVCGGMGQLCGMQGQVPLGWEGRKIASWINSALGVSVGWWCGLLSGLILLNAYYK